MQPPVHAHAPRLSLRLALPLSCHARRSQARAAGLLRPALAGKPRGPRLGRSALRQPRPCHSPCAPCLALPCLALPGLALSCLASPCSVLPCLSLSWHPEGHVAPSLPPSLPRQVGRSRQGPGGVAALPMFLPIQAFQARLASLASCPGHALQTPPPHSCALFMQPRP